MVGNHFSLSYLFVITGIQLSYCVTPSIIIIIVINYMQGIYNYIPEKNHVCRVYSVSAVLFLKLMLHVMLFRMWNTFCTLTLSLSIVCVQCPIWLFFAVPWFRAFLVCCSGIVGVILKWFQSPYYNWYHFCFHIPQALNFYYEVFIF
jgi:chromate transport protein ChrA